MKDHPTHHPKDIRYDYEREDAFQQSALNVSKTRHTKRRRESVNSNNESNFSYLNMIKLNKGVMWVAIVEAVFVGRGAQYRDLEEQQDFALEVGQMCDQGEAQFVEIFADELD